MLIGCRASNRQYTLLLSHYKCTLGDTQVIAAEVVPVQHVTDRTELVLLPLIPPSPLPNCTQYTHMLGAVGIPKKRLSLIQAEDGFRLVHEKC